MLVNQDQIIIENQLEKPPIEPPKQYCLYFVLPMFLGIALSGIPLAITLTLFLKNPCKRRMVMLLFVHAIGVLLDERE